MAGEFLSVPGNVKQIFLPFVLDPNNAINNTPIDVAEDSGNKAGDKKTNTTAANAGGEKTKFETQVFSFRDTMCPGGGTAETDGYLRIAPNSFYDQKQAIANDDISYKLLYGYDAASGKPKVNVYKDILDNLPRISIREYLQDAKLDQVMNLFSSLSKGFEAGSAAAAKVDDEEAQRRGFLEKFTGVIGQAVNGGSVLLRNIGKVMADIFADTFEKAEITTQGSLNNNNLANYVLRLPYMLYYRMLSATTTNIYEIPYNGQILYESSGGGWNTKRHLIDGVDGSENSALGVLRNFIGKNIRANTTPTWDGASDETGIKVDVEFSLFNDSVDAAVKNFIFTNTIVPGNMWMQYHVFQHAPNLYDIRIEGIKRLFMCQGDFKVETMGVLRKPSKEFFKRLDKHLNSGIKLTASGMEDLIKIPDIYKVTCSFTSLLPNNFNNYLYSYYNNSTISKIEKKENLHTPSLLDPAINKAAEEIAAIFQYPNVAQAQFSRNNVEEGKGYLDDMIKAIKAAAKDKDEKKRILTENELKDKVK